MDEHSFITVSSDIVNVGRVLRADAALRLSRPGEHRLRICDVRARNLRDLGILVEPDSRELWFICEAHDERCVSETASKFEQALDLTLDHRKYPDGESAAN